MNKHQKPTLEVRKALHPNHNETCLKVHKGTRIDQNEISLKVRKSLHPNHNETMLKVCKGIQLDSNSKSL